MDPVGFGVGVVGLVGLVSTCIQGYQIAHGMNLFEQQTRVLFLKLNTQRLFFIQWAETCRQAPTTPSTPCLSGSAADKIIQQTLQEIIGFLGKAANLQRKYGIVAGLGGRSKYTVDGDKIGLRRKLNFQLTDREDFDYVIGELSTFNDHLQRLLPTMRAREAIAKALFKRRHLIEDAYAWDNDDPPNCGTDAAGVAAQIEKAMEKSMKKRRREALLYEEPSHHARDDHDYRDRYTPSSAPRYTTTNDWEKEYLALEDRYLALEDRHRRRERYSPSPPPAYAQSQYSGGSRHSKHSSSSASTTASRSSRKSNSDAAREMFGDLMGFNGRRYSAYR